ADIEGRTRLLRDYGARIREYDASLADSRELLKRKAVGFYKGALIDALDLTLARTELSGYLPAAVARDRETLAYYQRVSRMKKAAQQDLSAQTKALNRDLALLDARMQDLEREKGKKQLLLAQLKQETRSYQQEIERLMERIRVRKKQEQTVYTGIARNKGSLPWPVAGTVVRRFGRYRQRRGADITGDRYPHLRGGSGQERLQRQGGLYRGHRWLRLHRDRGPRRRVLFHIRQSRPGPQENGPGGAGRGSHRAMRLAGPAAAFRNPSARQTAGPQPLAEGLKRSRRARLRVSPPDTPDGASIGLFYIAERCAIKADNSCGETI
ncbi:MAG TPA: hypothetical protein PLB81_00485, partial [Deltaproteobacteria bacterium]|nr:hypothetical protein [Deltaproteobacteria bacterium]